jgi:tetratricopeptide (TPR) repeat protein
MASESPTGYAEEGKRAYNRGQYDEAARLFERAAQGYRLARQNLLAAEMNNNLSVSLLQAGKPRQALDAALGTDEEFASASDPKRQAMALGNQAAAMEALHRYDDALQTYARAEAIFTQIGESDMLSLVKKSMAAIRLRRGQFVESALNMVGSVEAKSRPSFFERILKFLLRLKRW